MSLVADIQSKPLTATLHYLKRGAEKPTRYVEDPPPGVPQWNGIDDPRQIGIEDARGREGEFTLDRNGFQLVKAASHVGDFYAPEEVERIYYPEVEKLLRNTLGVSRVKIFDHTVRNAARSGAREPSRRVHNDHTLTSAPRRVRDHLGEEAPELLK
ncbi:MAG TPA: CmcJ/NvfI family oxidoreductase, partial [Reyranella sp.]|nr:CmcJ/NvfI family oxidoreductase [Reyranella sp.]